MRLSYHSQDPKRSCGKNAENAKTGLAKWKFFFENPRIIPGILALPIAAMVGFAGLNCNNREVEPPAAAEVSKDIPYQYVLAGEPLISFTDLFEKRNPPYIFEQISINDPRLDETTKVGILYLNALLARAEDKNAKAERCLSALEKLDESSVEEIRSGRWKEETNFEILVNVYKEAKR